MHPFACGGRSQRRHGTITVPTGNANCALRGRFGKPCRWDSRVSQGWAASALQARCANRLCEGGGRRFCKLTSGKQPLNGGQSRFCKRRRKNLLPDGGGRCFCKRCEGADACRSVIACHLRVAARPENILPPLPAANSTAINQVKISLTYIHLASTSRSRRTGALAGRCKRGEAKKDPDHIGRSRCADSITCSRSQERGAAQFDAPLYLPPRYFKMPSSKARMSTVATRSRATSSPGARRLPAGSS